LNWDQRLAHGAHENPVILSPKPTYAMRAEVGALSALRADRFGETYALGQNDAKPVGERGLGFVGLGHAAQA
jgi:hypothetical protein